ncbi:MAG: type II secretion system F family protein [Deltaproteobacteria bacterium]|nr:type II secretion system F family protein [Deltaproteobacteria bacterium]
MILLMLGAALSAGISVFIIVFEGIAFLEQGADVYREKVANQVKELDELYIKMVPQKLFYLNITSCFLMFVLVSILTSSILLGVLCSPSGLFISKLWIKFMRMRRLNLFNEQFLDAIGVISNALKSGLSLQQALARVALQYPAPLSQELSMISKEVALGVPLERSLLNVCKRVESEDLDLFVTATSVVKDTGGNLSEMFDTIADTLRERNTIRGKIKALTAQGRMQGIVIGIMPVALGFILYKLDPNLIMPLFNDPIGWAILFIIVLFEAIGAFFIAKIIRIDV